MHRRITFAAWLCAGLPLADAPAAQSNKPPAQRPAQVPRVDPYTRHDARLLTAAGYVSLGPFEFADGHDTRAIEATTGDDDWRWIETAHFKIGSSLAAWSLSKGDFGRASSRAELTRLRQKLPRVPENPAILDPWLRLHLYAQRCEDVYSDFQRRLGVSDESFPKQPHAGAVRPDYMGEGPYLGQRAKYTVLLCGRAGTFARYLQRWAGSRNRTGTRHHFTQCGSILFATSQELCDGVLHNDVALHCHVVYHLVHNLIDGYKGYLHDIPVWFKVGLAQWFARNVDPHYLNYDDLRGDDEATAPLEWDWRPKVLGLATTGAFTPAARLLERTDYRQLRFADTITSWSRVDWLLETRAEGLRVFLDAMKTPFHDGFKPPTAPELLRRQEQALQLAWHVNAESFDQGWQAHVRKRYVKQ